MDVVIDTDMLSTFVKIGKAGLLTRLFPKSKILVCPAVYSEIKKAVILGILDSVPTARALSTKVWPRIEPCVLGKL